MCSLFDIVLCTDLERQKNVVLLADKEEAEARLRDLRTIVQWNYGKLVDYELLAKLGIAKPDRVCTSPTSFEHRVEEEVGINFMCFFFFHKSNLH
jgi:hypothetical protein